LTIADYLLSGGSEIHFLSTESHSPVARIFLLKVEIKKLDCVLSRRATRPYIYDHTSANAYVLIYV
jgi:hypothetical protein